MPLDCPSKSLSAHLVLDKRCGPRPSQKTQNTLPKMSPCGTQSSPPSFSLTPDMPRAHQESRGREENRQNRHEISTPYLETANDPGARSKEGATQARPPTVWKQKTASLPDRRPTAPSQKSRSPRLWGLQSRTPPPCSPLAGPNKAPPSAASRAAAPGGGAVRPPGSRQRPSRRS